MFDTDFGFHPSLKKQASFSSFMKDVLRDLNPQPRGVSELASNYRNELNRLFKEYYAPSRSSVEFGEFNIDAVPKPIREDVAKLHSVHKHRVQHEKIDVKLNERLYSKTTDKYRERIRSKGFNPDDYDPAIDPTEAAKERVAQLEKERVAQLEEEMRNKHKKYIKDLKDLNRVVTTQAVVGGAGLGSTFGYSRYRARKKEEEKKKKTP